MGIDMNTFFNNYIIFLCIRVLLRITAFQPVIILFTIKMLLINTFFSSGDAQRGVVYK
jgi:hypothetical protein